MKVARVLNDIEQSMAYRMMPSEFRPSRRLLLDWMSNELNELSGRISNAAVFAVHLEPAIVCTSGTREYNLPKDFPLNFLRKSGDSFVCMIDDGTNEVNLEYVSPEEFYTMDLIAESNAKPTKYTIVTTQVGRRQLVLSPPPDDDYEIDGLYIPDWDLADEDSLPPIPGNCMVLKYGVLRRLNRDMHETDYQRAVAELMLEMARMETSVKASPKLGIHTNDYSLMG